MPPDLRTDLSEVCLGEHGHDPVQVQGVMSAEVCLWIRHSIRKGVQLHEQKRKRLGNVHGNGSFTAVGGYATGRKDQERLFDGQRFLRQVGVQFKPSARADAWRRYLQLGPHAGAEWSSVALGTGP